ncbi:DUF917 domain-containing protein [Bacillus sp. JJ1503]|uniref:DUF917 domain-containing protein n=1 Tax=unclassified Bacillus (in: firmicutes) TaxID=185979 RepID=UPI002FFF03F7
MRTLTQQEAEDILYGACIYGTGGGGDLKEGLRIISEIYSNGKQVRMVSLEDVEKDWLIASPYYVGSVASPKKEVVEKLENLLKSKENVSVLAAKSLQKALGKKLDAVIPTELGANIAWAMETAASLNIPLVDADPAGRAVPDIAHTTFNIFDIPIAPFALANKYGDVLIVQSVANHDRAEDIARNFAISSGNIAGMCDHPILGERLMSTVIRDTLTNSERVGKARRLANEQGLSPINPICEAGQGRILIKGTVTSSNWKDVIGFIEGNITISSLDGKDYLSLWFRNEHMVARNGDGIVSIIPELITVVDLNDGHPILNPNCKEGMEVAVITYPAPQAWETEKGLAIFGPEYIGENRELYSQLKSLADFSHTKQA